LKERKPVAVDEWEADEDLTEYPIKTGDTIGYL
jgi:hypothetical protein